MPERSDSRVAVMAQQPSDSTGVATVIDEQPGARCFASRHAANGAAATLALHHCFVVGKGKAVPAIEVRAPIQSPDLVSVVLDPLARIHYFAGFAPRATEAVGAADTKLITRLYLFAPRTQFRRCANAASQKRLSDALPMRDGLWFTHARIITNFRALVPRETSE